MGVFAEYILDIWVKCFKLVSNLTSIMVVSEIEKEKKRFCTISTFDTSVQIIFINT